jgi:hypothetical protein
MITKQSSYEFDDKKGKTASISAINYLPSGITKRKDFVCAYSGDKDHGLITRLMVSTNTYAITKGNPLDYDGTEEELEFEEGKAKAPALCEIDRAQYLCIYSGGPPKVHPKHEGKGKHDHKGTDCKDHGFTVAFEIGLPLAP